MTHDKNAVRKILDRAKVAKREALTAPEARGICEAYGITIPKEGVAKTAEEAVKLASGIGFPVVMKIVSPQILHKTEAGGVVVGVAQSLAVSVPAFNGIPGPGSVMVFVLLVVVLTVRPQGLLGKAS